KEVFGNYRIIKDIDLQDLAAEADTYRLASSQMELTGKKSSEGSKEAIGKLDGNGFTIKGFALGDTYSSQNVENFGMFAKMSEGATVMNLNIVIGATNKEGEIFGVEAKNITNVGAIAGTVINSKIVNVNLTSLYEGTNSVTVRGKNIVGGLVGKVKGDSYISNIVVTDVSVTAVNYPENYKAGGLSYESFNSYSRINDDLNKTVSYAGGIIGVFDAYTASTQNTQTFSDAVVSSNTNGIMLKTKGAMQITGATVGGIVGYVGPLTIIQDALFDLAYVDDDSTQGLYSYNGFAGGIVGYNLGYLRQVRAEHNNTKPLTEYDGLTYQELIELGISSYYKPENLEAENSAIEVGNEVLFHHDKYYPIAIGGLVGMQRSGKIEKSYSKINVKTTNGYTGEGYAGGIIGAIEKIKEGEVSAVLHEVYATGDVRQAKYAGGIVGYIQDDSLSDPTKFEKVNALNYWGKWIFENKTMRVYAFAYTPGEIGAEKDLGGLEKTSARYLFEEFPDKKADLETNFTQQAGRTPKFTEMNEVSVNDNGEMFDQIFKGNDWDSNSWGRDEDELYPHMLFGYHSNVIVIRNQNDIEKLRTTDENTFGNITYVIEPDDSIENIHEGDVHLIGVNKKFAPIVGFSNILRGVDDKHQYGFYFYDKNQTKALFKSTSNATFKDFVIRYNGIKLTNTTSQGAAFVEVANNTEFSNLELSGITVENKNILRSDVGILCAVAKGTTVFSNIDFNNCNINLASSTAGGFNVGMLFGNATLSGGRISNIRFSMCGITTSSATASNINLGEIEKSSNIGTIGGALTYTGDEYAA
ncbi:MAG: hypothetical protein J6Q51_03505, partial [Clostridia bacterium]|nr:hypothetical protein [Clostridia bacterium]